MQRFCQNPLSLSKTDNDQVPVNGIAMAPYMISVALFVAAISTNMILRVPSGRHPESRWAWLKSRAEINGIIAGFGRNFGIWRSSSYWSNG